MKKELQKALRVLAVVVTLGGNQISFAQSSTEGAHSAPAKGRAVFSVEDLKTLLSLNTRDPSSSSATHTHLGQEAQGEMYSLNIQMSDMEKARLSKKVSEIEAAKIQLVAQTETEITKKKTDIRKQRKTIQSDRTSGSTAADASMSKKLFENLIQEANLDTVKARRISEFNAANVFVIDYQEVNGERSVQTISVGQNTVWSNHSAQIAAK